MTGSNSFYDSSGSIESESPVQFEMYVMPVSDFVALTTLQPHQELKRAGKLELWKPSMKHVFFVSHEWTSNAHPDHSDDQLATFRTLLIRMLSGECPDTAPDWESVVYLHSGLRIRTSEWQKIVRNAYVW